VSKILVVEDDPGLRRVLLSALQHAGYDVRAVDNGRDAFRAIRESAPAVVVTDIVMPDSDGLEVIRLLRTDHPKIRIIAMSGGGIICGTTYLEIARLLGAHAVLRKPILPSDLVHAVGELLEPRDRATAVVC
jgi:CheY-like chemotaxis protein